MSAKKITSVVALGALTAAAGLSGCGRMGQLDQPSPMFGARAKAQYQQRRAAERQRAADQANTTGSAERTDQDAPGTDNAPRSTRQMQDPNQQNTPASSAPIPGSVPDPFGPRPSTTPPGR